jgi:methyl-accepting chemotaxis protein
MKIRTKLVLAAVAAVVLTTGVGLLVQRMVIRNQGIELTKSTMRGALVEAENVRQSMSNLGTLGAFDYTKMKKDADRASDLRATALYGTVPVVSAWKAIERVAAEEHYDFRIPKFQPRNPANQPSPDEAKILKHFETSNAPEYFQVDEANNQIVYARPIRLTADCMGCHGDPRNSPTHDGKDIVGFAMEGWHEGEIHGAFVLKAKLDRVDKTVQASMGSTLLWILPLGFAIAAGFYWIIRVAVLKPLGNTIESIRAASEETAASASQLSQAGITLGATATRQAASVEETSAVLHEMTGTTQQSAGQAREASTLANQMCRTAGDSGSDMDALEEAVKGMEAAGKDISRVTKTVNEIALQTNLLALNAAVEAARAGQAGVGFAVVADEVRKLALRCTEAADETSTLIDAAMQRMGTGVELSARMKGRLSEISANGGLVNETVAQITLAADDQMSKIKQVGAAMNELSTGTQAVAANAEESAAATGQMSAQSENLRTAIGELSRLL